MPTIHDVAKKAGVSVSTVSYALNGNRPISEETRQRIIAAMNEIGYQPHALARGLASKRSRIIALQFPTPERGLGITELEFVTGAADAAVEYGYNLVLWSSQIHDAHGLAQLTQQGLVDGVILMEVRGLDPRVELLRKGELPFQLIGRCDDLQGIHYVDIDFEQTLGKALGHLMGLGHRQIAFLNQSEQEYNSGYGPSVRAQLAFEQAMNDQGLRPVSIYSSASPQSGYDTMKLLLEQNPQISALISMNERALSGVLRALHEAQRSIPNNFSLISIITSARAAQMMNPPLTTMTSPNTELGRLSVIQLIERLEGNQPNELRQVLLPCVLEQRESTGPFRKQSRFGRR
jgi:DNA-binding LacI/PurR family transcriptional regulator